MQFDYHDRMFRAVENVAAGDVTTDTLFHYRQCGAIVWATYQGGAVAFGTITARVQDDGSLDMRYQQVTTDGRIRSGRCRSVPELLPDGRLRLHESWCWTEGGEGEGRSMIEEIAPATCARYAPALPDPVATAPVTQGSAASPARDLP